MSQSTPNILHIFTDQLRFDAIGAHNNPAIKTPNIDRLIAMGVDYQNAYTPSPVCVAARCSMITGQYPPKTKCFANDAMPTDVPSFMDVLAQHGYRTHGVGKCHFTPERNALRGFQVREIQEELTPEALAKEPYYQALTKRGFDYAYEAHGVRGPMYYIPQPSRLPADLHPTNWIGQRSVAFLEETHTKPWYLFASFIHPHPPFAPPVPWHKLYDPVRMPLPKHTQNDEAMTMFVNQVQNRYKYRDNGYDVNLVRCMKAYYYACVSFVDFQVGKLLDTLERTGQLDNTLIVFTADHGELLGDYGCFGKRSMHDGPAKIPFVLYQKGVFEGGKRPTTPVSLVDLAPTFLGAAGIDTSVYALDGVDLAKDSHDYVYSVFSCYREAQNGSVKHIPAAVKGDKSLLVNAFGNYMITDEGWKYIYSAPDGKEFLFDKIFDEEYRNLAGVPSCKAVQQRLKLSLMAYLEGQGITCLSQDGEWIPMPKFELPDNPDSGLITQNITCEWYDETLPGYSDET